MKISDQMIIDAIRKKLPEADVKLKTLDCSKLGYCIEVTSSLFKGQTLVNQHRIIKSALANLLDSGTLHAITLKTKAA